MNNKKRSKKHYCIVILPLYRYARISIPEAYTNSNLENLFNEIGKHYICKLNNPDYPHNFTINDLCRFIKDDINKAQHLNRNRMRKRGKQVSKTQIKSLFYSFTSISGDYIQIPFALLPIMAHILNLVHGITTDSRELNELKKQMNRDSVGDVIYNYPTRVFNTRYEGIIYTLDDAKLQNLYERLNANINGEDSPLTHFYDNINSETLITYKIT